MSQLFQPVPFEGGIQHECYLGVRRPKEGNKKMVTISTQSDDPLSLQEGATFKDKSGNFIRLLSVCENYCNYVYLSAATSQRFSMHGSVTGRSRRDVFAINFVLATRFRRQLDLKSRQQGAHFKRQS